ncbi:hypothetical protein FACS1894137_19830 [Spirochaetia bacterium]|nr:hypothetical protein FACS1894137_19830 [Spirochaetia bacterium]
MPKEFRPGWEYMNSAILGQEIAIHLETGRVYCADGVQYQPEEIAIMEKSGAEITLGVHLVKSLFEGTIVDLAKNSRMAI